MCNALILAADPAEAPRAARWLAGRLSTLGCAPSVTRAAAARLEAGWGQMVAFVYPAARPEQMLMLSIGGGPDRPTIELIAERRGRIPPATAGEAGPFGPVPAGDTTGIDGLTRLAFAV